jgi:predicted  nucleic acid-binding Zn-ribbon protein
MDEIREDYRQLIRNGEIKSNDKVPFWCDIDKEYYWQKLNKHSRQGCPKCGIKKQTITRTKKDYPFIDEIREDYQLKIKNGEISANEKVPFYCEKHGEYWKTLYLYEKSPGCPICNKISSGKKQRRTEYPFMYEIRTDYQEKIKNSEITCEDKVPFICDKHGEYWQNLGEHLYNNIGCPKCNTNISNSEQEVYNFIKEYYPNTVNNIRNLILNSKRELDIYIPELKIGIEYNGVIWHSEKFDDDKYNLLNKTKIFNNLGIRIIHIFEDEWYYKQDIVKKKLLHILNKDNSEKIYARNCIIKEISSKECKDFLDINHIQGNDNSKYRYGLFNNDNLVAVMTFKKNNKSIESKDWELSRYATSTTVIGGFNKLFNYAKNNIGFNKVITFADLRWSDLNNNIYEKTGWIKEYITKPNYFYVGKGYTRIYRFSMRKNILKDKLDYFDPNLTEVENCAVNGYYRLFDCGSIKYSKKYQS